MVESPWPVYKSREMTSMDRRCGMAEYHRLSNSIYAVRSTYTGILKCTSMLFELIHECYKD